MPTPRRGTILVVDDLESMTSLVHRHLAQLGHTVLTANSGAEALALARRHQGGIDLVLSDVVMPGMNGTELAATLIAEFSGLPIVLMSAFAAAGMTRVGFGETVIPVLETL